MTSWALSWSSHRSGAAACSRARPARPRIFGHVEDRLDARQGGVELAEGVGTVEGGHVGRAYASGAGAGVALATPTSASSSGKVELLAKHYANCSCAGEDYPHGVSKNDLTKKQWSARGATAKPAVRPGIYTENKGSLDRDKDFIACER